MDDEMTVNASQATVVLVTAPPMPRFADPVGTPLAACGDLRRVDWPESMADEERFRRFDEELPDADAVVVAPWNSALPPFTPERWASASRLKVIAGTFDNRFGHWIDVADAARRGVTRSLTLRAV